MTAKLIYNADTVGITHESYTDLCEAIKANKATIDGHPARVSGRRLTRPEVWSDANPNGGRFSWVTIFKIVNEGGNFKTQI